MKHRSSKDDVQASVSAADTNGKALQKAERKAARKAARKAVKRREKAEHKAAATAAAAVEGTTSTYQIQSSRNDIQAQTESNLDSSEALASLLWLDRALQDSDLQQPDHGPSRVPPPPPPAPTTATDAVDSSEAPASCADAQSASVGPEELNTTAPSQAQLVQNGQKRDRNKPSVQQSADQGSCSTSSKARVTPKGKEKGNIDPTPVSAIRLGATSSAKLVAARKVASELQYRKSAAKGDESVATSNGQSGGGGVSAADPDAAARSARQQHVVDNARGLTHEEMLADKMYADNELYWLADAYGLQWIRGRFTKIESDAIMEAIDKWRKGRGLSEQELLDQLFKESASAKRTRKDLEDDMWSIATRAAPGRASVAVRRHVREKLRPGMAKGPWSVEEQIALAKAVQEFGVGKWTKVSERIGRSMVDCKARWRTNPNMPSDAGPSTQARVSGETSQTGEAAASGSSAAGTPSKPRRKWANPQDDLLAHAVDEWCQENDANPATDRIGWKVIATRLQKELGDVTGHQCMKRW
ncbi:hypothetical protein K437DRAFT_105260 [Tilletiaria anomala UBC 951]|uniref:Myb-like domain-containing protein n=1 Tax=Tilletiaria anomala (strain ATCC 24038 / CBS 436.72 / UBC 951) TaxID=1037660 RepID=A0A066W7U2_TILAU|nr:uncharacterized protein K437DRAFT_105260 [Tilletiaria anomala UBC 951]KDN46825.1 hypothetical protein K437DRAFT_105260 [Tilletiaria anomala UBC 951]